MLQRQIIHLLSLLLLLTVLVALYRGVDIVAGSYLGISTWNWFYMALAIPVLHQLFVAIVWRVELYHQGISRWLGRRAFRIYAVIFFILFASRLLFIIPLAVADRNSLQANPVWLYSLSILLTLPVAYTFYSVTKYFGFPRALGIDHFDPAYRNAPLVRRGMFRYTRNAMYLFGIAVLWLPGLLLASKAALLAALFNHLYIWVHYYTVELPDMRRIYGRGV